MQFDFLKRLFVAPLEPTPPAPTPAPKSTLPEQPQATGRDATLESQARDLLAAAGAPELGPKVRVLWNARMRSTAGLARGYDVVLNAHLRQVGSGEIDRTLRHELAHILARHRAGRRRIAPHGVEWRAACAALGIPGEERCHTLPLPTRQLSRGLHYQCPQCQQRVARVRPLKCGAACLKCCRQYSGGRYDPRFRFVRCAPPAS